MKKARPVGITDIGLYVPKPRMDLDVLIARRVGQDPRLERHLERAVKTTGQRSIRFPESWEDSATMAAAAAEKVLTRNNSTSLREMRYLVTGTESGLDHSKPLSAYVQGMLQSAGHEIPKTVSSYQIQHACAGATLGLVNVGSMIGMRGRTREYGVVIASDVARYSPSTTAEVTQGAGAAALLVETDPKLIELDFQNVGYCSTDVDDFFRPNGSKVAQVQGRFSMECYMDNFIDAFADHAAQVGRHPAEILTTTDMFVLHTPFRNMPEMAMKKLLGKHLGLVNGDTESFLEGRGFYEGIDAVGRIGNTYSASLYIALAYTLRDRYQALGKGIVGKKIVLGSYGSGNTMIVISGTVAAGAPAVIESWDLDEILDAGEQSGFEKYESWLGAPYIQNADESEIPQETIPVRSYYLSKIREDGYRMYTYRDTGTVSAVPEKREDRTIPQGVGREAVVA